MPLLAVASPCFLFAAVDPVLVDIAAGMRVVRCWMTVGRAFRCRRWWFRLALFRWRSGLVYTWFLFLFLGAVLEGNMDGFDDLVCVMIVVADSSGR